MGDSEKLNKLADWFDFQDALNGNPGHEVQDDLRRIAKELSALRARLAECEGVVEQAIYAIHSGGERHLFADESEAIELYEAYKSKHAPTEKG